MKKLLASTFAALMLCLPLSIQAKVGHLLPKVHSLTETKGTPFALHRAVTITDDNNTVALKEVFTDYGCTLQEGATATVTVQMVESIEGCHRASVLCKRARTCWRYHRDRCRSMGYCPFDGLLLFWT